MDALSNDKVFELFVLYSGLSAALGEVWRPLCENAVSALKDTVNRKKLTAHQVQRLETAAAAFAYADYLALSGGSFAGEQIKVGDISIGSTRSDAKQNSNTIREYFSNQIADVIGGDNFYFSTIGGVPLAAKDSKRNP